ncbi:peptidase S8/S53 domain-containing protein [Chytridium lagenaria]|nr:peptidase S8/S53 domain-containing protein [Chytridium lagenaria]
MTRHIFTILAGRIAAVASLAVSQDVPEIVPNSWIVILAPGSNWESHVGWLSNQLKAKWTPVEGFDEPLLTYLKLYGFRGNVGTDFTWPNRYHYMHAIQRNPAASHLPVISGNSDTYNFPDTAGAGVAVYVLDTGVDAAPSLAPPFIGTNDTTGDPRRPRHPRRRPHLLQNLRRRPQLQHHLRPCPRRRRPRHHLLPPPRSSTTPSSLPGQPVNPPSSTSRWVDPKTLCWELAVSQAFLAGNPVVAAAGNDGPGVDACAGSPAGASAAFTVGAAAVSFVDGTVSWAPFSNGGECVRGVAPGTNVGGVVSSGTSVAAPMVAGVMALLMGQRKFSSVDKIYDAVNELAFVKNGVKVSGAPNNTFNYLLFNGGEQGFNAITPSTTTHLPTTRTTTRTATRTTRSTSTPLSPAHRDVLFGVGSGVQTGSKGLIDPSGKITPTTTTQITAVPTTTSKTMTTAAPQTTSVGKMCGFPACLGDPSCDACVVPMSLMVARQQKESA